MKREKTIVSVIVCTYNRAQLLKSCLRSLDDQTANRSLYEVIIVNNNSTDSTQKFVEDFVRRRPNFRVVIEKKQGLSHARNRGWREAKGRYVAYIDDDALAQPDWIEQIVTFIKNNPKINAFGGPYGRFSQKPLPNWFPESYATLNLGDKVKKVDLENEWISGSSMILNKSVFKKYGGFNTELGMKGGKILYGEETEFLLRLKKGKESVYYVPTVKVKHLVAEYKFNIWWVLKNDYFHNVTISLISKTKLNFLKGLFLFVKGLLILPFYLFNVKKDPFERKVYFGLSNLFSSVGRISGSIRGKEYKIN